MRAVKSGALIAQNVAPAERLETNPLAVGAAASKIDFWEISWRMSLPVLLNLYIERLCLRREKEHRYGPHIAQKVLIRLVVWQPDSTV